MVMSAYRSLVIVAATGATLAAFPGYAQTSMPQADSAGPLPPPGLLARAPAMRGQYLAPLLELRQRAPRYLESTAFRRQFLGISAVYATFIGRYAQAHADHDRIRPPRADPDAPPLPKDATPFAAIEAVVELARERRVVFVNEAHHVPQHRAFALELIRALRNQGFTVFAAEMVTPEDTALVRRGYPAAGVTGIYTDEPLAAALVREAMRLGFRVVAYDGPFPCDDSADDPMFCMNERERLQADVLAEVLATDPGARMVVHTGYAHLHEEPSGEWIPMAVRFRDLTGIDPLTVDQTVMTERSGPEFEDRWYGEAIARGLVRHPVVLRVAGDELVRGAAVDLQVFHPRTQLVDGRPQWLPADRHRIPVYLLPQSGPVLVQAFHAAEGPDAVPADQFLVEGAENVPPLALAPGAYRLIVSGPAGPLQPEMRIVVTETGRVETERPR